MIYKIQNDAVSAEIDSFGALLKSYKNTNGYEYIYQPKEGFWQNSAPVLFPMVGGLYNDKTIINGGEYSMLRHGFARSSQFTVADQTADSITFELLYNETTLSQYPYKFKFQVIFTLNGTKLTNTYKVFNIDNQDMLFSIGAHPGFRCPMDEDDAFENYVIEFEQNETVLRPHINKEGLIDLNETSEFLKDSNQFSLTRSMFDNDAIIFTDLKSRKVKLYSKKTGHGVSMNFTGFKHFGVWTQVGMKAPFVCLEPWIGMGDCVGTNGLFQDKVGMMTLEQNKEFAISFTLDQL